MSAGAYENRPATVMTETGRDRPSNKNGAVRKRFSSITSQSDLDNGAEYGGADLDLLKKT